MTEEEVEILWQKAIAVSHGTNEKWIRRHFAELLADRERETCAGVCIKLAPSTKTSTAYKVLHEAARDILRLGEKKGD